MHGLKRGIQWCPPGRKNFVHARDVAQGIHRALKVGRKGQCYLLAGENLTYREFFSMLDQVVGRRPYRITVPKILIHAAAMVAEGWNKLNDQISAFNKTNARLLTLDNYYAGEKAKREFNLFTTPVRDAIEEAICWFKNENYISADNYSTHGTNFDL